LNKLPNKKRKQTTNYQKKNVVRTNSKYPRKAKGRHNPAPASTSKGYPARPLSQNKKGGEVIKIEY